MRVKVSYFFLQNFENYQRFFTGEPCHGGHEHGVCRGVFEGKLSFNRISAGIRLCTSPENPYFWVPTIKVRPPDGSYVETTCTWSWTVVDKYGKFAIWSVFFWFWRVWIREWNFQTRHFRPWAVKIAQSTFHSSSDGIENGKPLLKNEWKARNVQIKSLTNAEILSFWNQQIALRGLLFSVNRLLIIQATFWCSSSACFISCISLPPRVDPGRFFNLIINIVFGSVTWTKLRYHVIFQNLSIWIRLNSSLSKCYSKIWSNRWEYEMLRCTLLKLIHTSLFPPRCPSCGQAFAQKSSLVRHAKLHEGRKDQRGVQDQPQAPRAAAPLGPARRQETRRPHAEHARESVKREGRGRREEFGAQVPALLVHLPADELPERPRQEGAQGRGGEGESSGSVGSGSSESSNLKLPMWRWKKRWWVKMTISFNIFKPSPWKKEPLVLGRYQKYSVWAVVWNCQILKKLVELQFFTDA